MRNCIHATKSLKSLNSILLKIIIHSKEKPKKKKNKKKNQNEKNFKQNKPQILKNY